MKKLVIFFGILLFLPSIFAVTYYVDATDGSDSNDGLTQATAWKTLGKVETQSFSPGDNVYFQRGETWREFVFEFPSSGAPGNPITLGAYGTGPNPIFSGATEYTSFTQDGTSSAGNLLNEHFENSSGYDEFDSVTTKFWENTITGSATLNMNANTGSIGSPVNWGSEYMRSVTTSANEQSMIYHKILPPIEKIHVSFDVIIGSESLGNSQYIGLLRGETPDRNHYLSQYPDTLFFGIDLFQNSAGNLLFRMREKASNPSSWTYHTGPSISTGTKYTIDIKWDLETNTWEWRIDGTVRDSGSITGIAQEYWLTTLFVGLREGNAGATVYFDNIEADSDNYEGNRVDNLYYYSRGSEPVLNQVFVDNKRLRKVSLKENVHEGSYWWDDANNRVYIRGDPTGKMVEDSVVQLVFRLKQSHITIEDIDFHKAKDNNFQITHGTTAPTGIRVNRVTALGARISNMGVASSNLGLPRISDVIFRDCVSTLSGGNGLGAWGNAENISYINCTSIRDAQLDDIPWTHEWTSGFKLGGFNRTEGTIFLKNVTISRCTAIDTGLGNPHWPRGHGIWSDVVNTGHTIEYSTVINAAQAGIFFEHTTQDSKANYNIIIGSRHGLKMSANVGTNVSGNEFNNNLIYLPRQYGIVIEGHETTPGGLVNNKVYNNLVVTDPRPIYNPTGDALVAMLGGENDGIYGIGNVYFNNSFGTDRTGIIMWGAGNRFDTYDAWENAYCGSNGCSHSIEGDPLLNDPENGDFTLQSNSPAIDAGINLGLLRDFAGTPVPQGSAPDVGAFEYLVGGIAQTAYNPPHNIPGRIEAEDYDSGGEGISYHDTSSGNNGGLYRTDGVDLKLSNDTGGGYAIGWITTGEWLEYTVNVGTIGYYDISFRVLSQVDTGKFHLEVDGVNVTGVQSVPITGNWNSEDWTTLKVSNISLTGGSHILRFVVDSQSFDFNYMDILASGSSGDGGNGDTGTPGTSGGGGGGGAGSGTSSTPSVTESKTVPQAKPPASILFTGFNPDLRIKQVEVKINSEVQNAGLAISKYDSRPEVIPVEKKGLVYRYLEFQEINIGDSLDKAIITFFVDRDWVDGNELEPPDVTFFRYNDGLKSWNELPTTYNTSDDDYYYYYYEAESDDFGFFAIGEKGSSLLKSKIGGVAVFAIIGVLILLGIIVAIVVRLKKRNQAYDAGTYPLAKK